ncbi:MAG: exodeoxyribonuclease III, partial [Magnetospiraceae bacterium]
PPNRAPFCFHSPERVEKAMTGLRVVTWNVNSVRRRLDQLIRLDSALQPDVLCLQETKVMDAMFPTASLAALGYTHAAIHGQKAYNGVAIFSRKPMTDHGTIAWVGKDDRRHIWAEIDGIELHNLYVPAGGDIPDPKENPKFDHKLNFLDEMIVWSGGLDNASKPRLLVGDLNVAPLETDVWSHKQLRNVVSHTEPEIARLNQLQAAGGWVDAQREITPPDQHLYTWWSYRARDWKAANKGRRLDHAWMSPALAGRLEGSDVFKPARDWHLPSDHAPVVVDLAG